MRFMHKPNIALARGSAFFGRRYWIATDVDGSWAVPDSGPHECSRYCLEQAASCLKMARLNISPAHRHTFMRLAAQWNQIAKKCGGQLQQWAQGCHNKPDSD